MAAKKGRPGKIVKRTPSPVQQQPSIANPPKQITIDVPQDRPLVPYRLNSGRTVMAYMAVKRQGKKEKPCCIYCERGFHQAPPKPLNAARKAKLNQRKAKKVEMAAGGIAEAIRIMRNTDIAARKPPKTTEEYLSEILAQSQSKIEGDDFAKVG
jgi:hypothetical protein